jgi:hypothetical protein
MDVVSKRLFHHVVLASQSVWKDVLSSYSSRLASGLHSVVLVLCALTSFNILVCWQGPEYCVILGIHRVPLELADCTKVQIKQRGMNEGFICKHFFPFYLQCLSWL